MLRPFKNGPFYIIHFLQRYTHHSIQVCEYAIRYITWYIHELPLTKRGTHHRPHPHILTHIHTLQCTPHLATQAYAGSILSIQPRGLIIYGENMSIELSFKYLF